MKGMRQRGRSRGDGVGEGESEGAESELSTLFSYSVNMSLFHVISFRFVPFRTTKKAIPRNREFCKMTTLFRVIKKLILSLSDSYPAFFLLIATTSNKNF
jgi:hypothetical protein